MPESNSPQHRGFRRLLLVGVACAFAARDLPAVAITLPEALALTYRNNPALAASRSGQRATDEGVIAAKSAALPQLSADASYDRFLRRSSNDPSAPRRQVSAGLQADLPIYAGGGTAASIAAAKARVVTGREGLRSTEGQILVDAATAYMNVLTDGLIVDFYRQQIGYLDENIAYARSGFEHGDLTRTDVDQAQTRRESAEGQYESAVASLDSSRQDFFRIVGAVPDNLSPPAPLKGLPGDAEQAAQLALQRNPDLLAARSDESEAGYSVRIAAAQRLPRVQAVASAGYNNYLNSFGGPSAGLFDQTSRTATVGIQASLPLYQGGLPAARIREARAIQSQKADRIEDVERSVAAQARSGFFRLEAGRRSIEAASRSIEASERALKGVRAELKFGTRTVLDLLNAEQEVLSARIQLARAERDTFVTSMSLLAVLGQADPQSLGLDGASNYDPSINYQRVKNRFWDYGGGQPPREASPQILPVSVAVLSMASSTVTAAVQVQERLEVDPSIFN